MSVGAKAKNAGESNGIATNPEYLRTPTGGVMTKVDRFKWTTADRPGEYRMIDKNRLEVDKSYQRAEAEPKVQRIARRWSWIACGTINVAERAGSYFVMDGGHRTLAARRRADIQALPCMVFNVDSIEQEAQGFLDANLNRKPMTVFDKFHALIMTGDEVAIAVDRMVTEAGYTIRPNGAKSGKGVTCLNALMKSYAADPPAFQAAWPLIVQSSEGGPINEKVVYGLAYIERRLRRQDMTLTRQPWRERVIRLGRGGMVEAANEAAAYYAVGGAKVWARGIVKALNHGVQKKLDIETRGEE